jgi:hypothetical protein
MVPRQEYQRLAERMKAAFQRAPSHVKTMPFVMGPGPYTTIQEGVAAEGPPWGESGAQQLTPGRGVRRGEFGTAVAKRHDRFTALVERLGRVVRSTRWRGGVPARIMEGFPESVKALTRSEQGLLWAVAKEAPGGGGKHLTMRLLFGDDPRRIKVALYDLMQAANLRGGRGPYGVTAGATKAREIWASEKARRAEQAERVGKKLIRSPLKAGWTPSGPELAAAGEATGVTGTTLTEQRKAANRVVAELEKLKAKRSLQLTLGRGEKAMTETLGLLRRTKKIDPDIASSVLGRGVGAQGAWGETARDLAKAMAVIRRELYGGARAVPGSLLWKEMLKKAVVATSANLDWVGSRELLAETLARENVSDRALQTALKRTAATGKLGKSKFGPQVKPWERQFEDADWRTVQQREKKWIAQRLGPSTPVQRQRWLEMLGKVNREQLEAYVRTPEAYKAFGEIEAWRIMPNETYLERAAKEGIPRERAIKNWMLKAGGSPDVLESRIAVLEAVRDWAEKKRPQWSPPGVSWRRHMERTVKMLMDILKKVPK